MPEASGRVVIAFLLGAAEAGVDVAGALDSAGLDTPDPDDRVPCEKVFALASTLAHRSADPLFGVQQATAFPPHHLGVAGHLLTTAPTLRDGLDAVAAVHQLYGDGLVAAVQLHDDTVQVALTLHESLTERPPSHVVESFLVRLTVAVQEASDGAAPLGVRFRHAPAYGASPSDYEDLLGFRVHFRCHNDAVIYRQSALDAPLPTRDPVMFRMLHDHAIAEMRRLQDATPLRDEVHTAICAAFDGTPVTAKRVASRLGMSVRTMQRLLAAEQTSFATLKDAAVWRYAVSRLERGASIDEVSATVGYSDSTGLRRAIRRTLTTPAR